MVSKINTELRKHGFYPGGIDETGNIIWRVVTRQKGSTAIDPNEQKSGKLVSPEKARAFLRQLQGSFESVSHDYEDYKQLAGGG